MKPIYGAVNQYISIFFYFEARGIFVTLPSIYMVASEDRIQMLLQNVARMMVYCLFHRTVLGVIVCIGPLCFYNTRITSPTLEHFFFLSRKCERLVLQEAEICTIEWSTKKELSRKKTLKKHVTHKNLPWAANHQKKATYVASANTNTLLLMLARQLCRWCDINEHTIIPVLLNFLCH